MFRVGNGSSYSEQQVINKPVEDNEGPWKHRYQCGDELVKVGLEKGEMGMLTIHTHFSSQLISTNFHLFIPHLLFTMSAVLSLPTLVFCPQLHSCSSSVLCLYNFFLALEHLVSGLFFLSLATAHFSFPSALYQIITIFSCMSNKKVKPDKQNWYPSTVLKYVCPLVEWTL